MSESLDKNTIFGEEYNHWKENGYSHVEAMNKARDYYRRFTRREALDGDGVILALVESQDPTIDDLVDFQRLFEKVVLNLVDEDIRLYCGLLQMCNADIFLTDHQQRFVGIVMRGASINTIGDLARWMGYTVRGHGTSQMLLTRRSKLRDRLRKWGFNVRI